MKLKKIFDIIFRNWQAKIVSLILASALWVYVGTGETRSAFFPGGVPLQIKNVPQNLVAITDVERVRIKLVADSETWKKLSSDSFSAYLNLGDLSEGTHEVKVFVTTNVENVQIVETDPAKVIVRLEPQIEKEVPVNLLIDGKAGDGFVAGEWSTDPQKVKVSGGKSLVESLLEATAKIQLDGQTSDFKKIVKLEGLDNEGKIINSLGFEPAQVTVDVSIVKASNVKTVGIKANVVGVPRAGFWISKIETEPQTVTIAASENMINKISYILTTEIDVSDIDANKSLEAALKPDSGITILDQIEKIRVSIFVAKSQASKEVQTGFQWENLSSNLRVTSVEPTTVTVVLSGPQDILANLTGSDLSLLVDLSGMHNPGTYSIDISRSNISGPTGISVSSIVPSAINVRVDTK